MLSLVARKVAALDAGTGFAACLDAGLVTGLVAGLLERFAVPLAFATSSAFFVMLAPRKMKVYKKKGISEEV